MDNTVESTSLSLSKFAKFIEANIHLDAECNDSFYFETVHKMDTAERLFQANGKKISLNSIEDDLDPLCKEYAGYWLDYKDELQELEKDTFKAMSTKYIKLIREKINGCTNKFYMQLGNIMEKYGILNLLVDRSNAAFARVGAEFLRCDTQTAIDEFKKSKKNSFPILSAKIAFAINKIVKYLDDVEYGDLLNDDSFNFKSKNDKKLKYISKLKTDYLKKFVNLVLCIESEDEIGKLISKYSEEYKKLFGEYFKELDFEKDILKVHAYELKKGYFYDGKAEMITHVICCFASSEQFRTKEIEADGDLNNWGLCTDANGNLLLGIELNSYPMPITVHIPRSSFKDIVQRTQLISSRGTYHTRLEVPIYHSLTGNKGLFPTNVLFRVNPKQLEQIKKAYEKDPQNPYLKFFYKQTSQRRGEAPKDLEYKGLEDFE